MILYVKDYLNVITSQYRDSPKFMTLMSELLDLISSNAKCLNAMNDSFDIDIALGEQLDIVGSIIGVDRQLNFQIESGSSILNDEDFRFLMKFKIVQNMWNGTTEDLANLWNEMFPKTSLIIYDNQDMTVTLLILGSLSSIQTQLLLNGLLLPKPVGISYTYILVNKTLFAYNLDTSQYNGYNKGYWQGDFALFALDLDSAIFKGLDEADWAS